VVTVLLNNGDGTFGTKTDYRTGGGPNSVVAADFNGDRHLDLATSNLSDSTVSVLLQFIPLQITKAATESSFQAAGETLHFTYTVKNNGQVLVNDVTVTDSLAGVQVHGCGVNQLQPNQSTTCQATYVTTAADVAAGKVVDRGTVTGTDANGREPTATSNEVTVPLAALTVTKSASPAQFTATGQTITYTYEVTNTGQVALSGLSVTDDGPGTPAVTCDDTNLAVGAHTTCHASYNTTAADVAAGKVTNTATATAQTRGGAIVKATSNKVSVPYAGLKIVKDVEETAYSATGQTLHYTFTVTNTGNVTLNNVAVADNGPGSPTVTCPGTTLAPGASFVCTATYTTTAADVAAGRITDNATVTATAGRGTTVTATSNTVTLVACTPCKDRDHGGCKGDRPEGRPWDHDWWDDAFGAAHGTSRSHRMLL
jgi:uncharacterized repeat protein (TIGR01451 family)